MHYSGHCKATEIEGDQRSAGERNGHSRFQVQLEEDGGGSTRHSLWPMLYWERQGLSQVSKDIHLA